MRYRGFMIIILVFAVFTLCISGVCAGDVDDSPEAGEDNAGIDLTATDNNLKTTEDDGEIISASDDEMVCADESTYSELSQEIGAGGNVELQHRHYTYDSGNTIWITEDNSVIDGKGAVIDMAGSNISVFRVTGSGVTIKNLAIKNVNLLGLGSYGAIYFSYFISGTVENCNFTDNFVEDGSILYFEGGRAVLSNCNFVNNSGLYGGAVYLSGGDVKNCNFTNNKGNYHGGAVLGFLGNFENCNFVNNSAPYDFGGALYIYSSAIIKNCNFTNNMAIDGGAAYFWGIVTLSCCNFVNNSAAFDGGALFAVDEVDFEYCNFTGNNALNGSAIYFQNSPSYSSDVYYSCFLDNRANVDHLEVVRNGNNIEITFIGRNNLLNAIYSERDIVFRETTYWGANGIENINYDSVPLRSNNESGQNITIMVVANGVLILNETKVTDENGKIVLDVSVEGDYLIVARHDEDSYYTQAQTSVTNMQHYVNVTSMTSYGKTANITAKSNIRNDIIGAKLIFILPNGDEISAKYNADGTWWALYTFDDYGDYMVNASYSGLDNVTVSNATVTVDKLKTELMGNSVTATYNVKKNLVITLKDSNGNPVRGAKITVVLKGSKTYTTDKNGQVKVPVAKLLPKSYVAKITFNGDTDHFKSTKSVKVKVKKAKSKLTAKKKSFRKSLKVKKYTVTLKTGKNPVKKVKVTLKIGKKTYTAKTNSKGKATFKIKKLSKKGTYKSKVTFKGNKYYKKVTKTVKIKIK